MNLLEMVAVLFAVIFFTSVALIYNNSAFRQREYLFDANAFVQAAVLAHEKLDEIDAKLLGNVISFENITSTFDGSSFNRNLQYVGQTYRLQTSVDVVDEDGVTQADDADTGYLRVSVLVLPDAGMKNSLTMSRIYADTD